MITKVFQNMFFKTQHLLPSKSLFHVELWGLTPSSFRTLPLAWEHILIFFWILTSSKYQTGYPTEHVPTLLSERCMFRWFDLSENYWQLSNFSFSSVFPWAGTLPFIEVWRICGILGVFLPSPISQFANWKSIFMHALSYAWINLASPVVWVS